MTEPPARPWRAYRPRQMWTPEQLAELRRCWRLPLPEIARRTGHSKAACRSKGRLIGLPPRAP